MVAVVVVVAVATITILIGRDHHGQGWRRVVCIFVVVVALFRGGEIFPVRWLGSGLLKSNVGSIFNNIVKGGWIRRGRWQGSSGAIVIIGIALSDAIAKNGPSTSVGWVLPMIGTIIIIRHMRMKAQFLGWRHGGILSSVGRIVQRSSVGSGTVRIHGCGRMMPTTVVVGVFELLRVVTLVRLQGGDIAGRYRIDRLGNGHGRHVRVVRLHTASAHTERILR